MRHRADPSVRDLKTYFFPDEGTVKAVDGADLRPSTAGKTLGIVGESGCGKSVTARSILRIVERPGRIVERRDPAAQATAPSWTWPSSTRRARRCARFAAARSALVFQEPMTSFSPVHTVGNQIIETIRLHQPRRASRRRGSEAIEMFRLGGHPAAGAAHRRVRLQLSGGLRQRAMIAHGAVLRARAS